MLAVRYLALLALVVWLGGLIVVGSLVAPSTFRVLEANDPATGRVLAGAVVGDILQRFQVLAYACGAVLLACLAIMKIVGPPPRAFPLRAAIAVLMLAMAVGSGVLISGGIESVQVQILMAATLGLGLLLLLSYARD